MSLLVRFPVRRAVAIALFAIVGASLRATTAAAADRMYFAATDNITDVLVQKINAETVRVDMSCWYLTEHSISIALVNKFKSGVPVRLIGDRGSIFEIDPLTRSEFYWLASQGVPIRLRFNPTWYPEIDHWKATIFAGQNLVAFGSANYTPFELAPWSATNYKDESVLLTDDSTIVNAFKTKYDRLWNDTTAEPQSLVPSPPYFKNWNDACIAEPTGKCDFFTVYPSPAPMTINTARLEPDNPLPADLIWGQGPEFNNRLVQEINNEQTLLQFVIYRVTVDNITNALLAKFQSGVPMQLIIEPNEYLNRKWPEFWLTHANIDKLWAAGVPIKWRTHDGLTHMKTLVTSTYATNASSNYAAAWQRDDDYFIAKSAKPTIYQAIKDRVTAMWNDTTAFAPFQPQPPDAPVQVSPASNSTGIATTTPLVWNIAPFAVSYDVYLGTSQANMTLAGNVPAQLVNDPPKTYSWTPTTALQPGTTYVWKVVSRTNATPVNASLVAPSPIWGFTTAGPSGPPVAPTNPTPSTAATGVGVSPTLGWSAGAVGTTFTVEFGSSNPPAPVATGLTSASYAPGILLPSTTYFWRVTAVSSGGTTAGSVWSFTTGSGTTSQPSEIVLYASDATPHGTWTIASDASAAGGLKLTNPDNGVPVLNAPLAVPSNYVDATFQAEAGTRYRVWLRIHALADSKYNDSVFVQFSDSVDAAGSSVYRTGTSSGYTVNLWTCATCQSFGWGWQRNGYWLADTGDVWFQNSGAHTIRLQIREDGAEIDQIVISPLTYATNAPGSVSNDTTIVPKPSGPTLPGAPVVPSPANTATGVSTNPTLSWSASGATSYDVAFGSTNPPPTVVSGASGASYAPPALTNATTYFWRIVARNASGSTTGAVWSFTTSTAAPSTPNSPSPADGAVNQSSSVTLTWSATGATSYDVLLGPTDPPSQVASGLTSASYSVSGLTPGGIYFWQIVAHNSGGANQGPAWSFTTAGSSPTAPGSPSPVNAATGVSTNATLSWSAIGATSYDVKFGTSNPPPLVVTGQTAASYTPALAAGRTYFWQVVANNATGSTPGAVWSFSTAAAPPSAPATPSPANGATGVSTSASLSWSATNATSYDVKFGTTNPPAPAVTGQAGTSYTPTLAAGATYFWQVVANNANGSTPGAVWSFTTAAAPQPPSAPATPSPASGATGVSTSASLSWSATNATSYDVKFGTTNPPAPAVTGQAGTSYTPTLAAGTTYFWQVVANNANGSTPGAVWSFTTAAAPQPPSVPATPSPVNGATGVSTSASLSWNATNATSYDVKFGTTNPPAQVVTGQTGTSYTPALAAGTTYFWQVVANNAAGSTAGPIWSLITAAAAPAPVTEVVIYASDIPSSALHGAWTTAADPTAAGGVKLVTPDTGFASTDAPLAAPNSYVDVAFTADGRTDYTLWIRMKALNDNKYNDSLWVQFAGALAAGSNVYTIGSTSALAVNLATTSTATSLNNWGWQNGAYWLSQPVTVQFATTGPHTMRIQVREDGVQFDQIVLSSTRYLTSAPGGVTNDTTIVAKP